MGRKAYLILDNKDILIVDEEKQVLVLEIIKHYNSLGRWADNARLAAEKGVPYSIGEDVGAMCKKISIDHKVISNATAIVHNVSILEPAEQPPITANSTSNMGIGDVEIIGDA